MKVIQPYNETGPFFIRRRLRIYLLSFLLNFPDNDNILLSICLLEIQKVSETFLDLFPLLSCDAVAQRRKTESQDHARRVE